MKYILSLTITLFCISVYSDENCSLKDQNLIDSSEAQQLFYTGTCHYRNKNFIKASEYWTKLTELSSVPEEEKKLQINANGNLGYLLFFGYGLKENKTKALTHWQLAASLGYTESEYHLCYAYGDSKQPTFNHTKALMHCEKAKLIYQGIENPDEDDILSLSHINEYLSHL